MTPENSWYLHGEKITSAGAQAVILTRMNAHHDKERRSLAIEFEGDPQCLQIPVANPHLEQIFTAPIYRSISDPRPGATPADGDAPPVFWLAAEAHSRPPQLIR